MTSVTEYVQTTQIDLENGDGASCPLALRTDTFVVNTPVRGVAPYPQYPDNALIEFIDETGGVTPSKVVARNVVTYDDTCPWAQQWSQY